MAERVAAAEALAATLEACGVRAAFGVISIHNLPILDAFVRRGRIRCIPARGEAGAANMADAYARVSGELGVVVTSTGTGAGNASGALVEAQSAGTPLLHLAGQIEAPFLERDRAYIHEAKDQLGMLRAVSKRAYRVWSADALVGTLREAIATALTPPMGPVSVELPIDVQSAPIEPPSPEELLPLAIARPALDRAALEAIAGDLAGAKRPLLWLGGGASAAVEPVRRLIDLGFAVVTTTHGRGVVPEDDPMCLGAFVAAPALEELYRNCDAMLIAGSRLRGNETLRWNLRLPATLYRIDADPAMRDRNYVARRFAAGEATEALTLLADMLTGKMRVDAGYRGDVARTREAAHAALHDSLRPYESVVDALGTWMPPDALWVRDITLSNSIWGNRYPPLRSSRTGVHALGGGIGQGLPMAIGAALAAGPERKTVLLTGDGGLQLCIGELATAVQEKANVLLVVMNDGGYGVIKNIQDDKFGGRHYLVNLHTPDFQQLAGAVGLPSARVADAAGFSQALATLGKVRGPALLEVDMLAIGPYAFAFAGPPVREGVKHS